MSTTTLNKDSRYDHSHCKHPPLQEDEWACRNCDGVTKKVNVICQHPVFNGKGRKLELGKVWTSGFGPCGYFRDYHCCMGWEVKLTDDQRDTAINHIIGESWKCCHCNGFNAVEHTRCRYISSRTRSDGKRFWAEDQYCDHERNSRYTDCCTNGRNYSRYNKELMEQYGKDYYE